MFLYNNAASACFYWVYVQAIYGSISIIFIKFCCPYLRMRGFGRSPSLVENCCNVRNFKSCIIWYHAHAASGGLHCSFLDYNLSPNSVNAGLQSFINQTKHLCFLLCLMPGARSCHPRFRHQVLWYKGQCTAWWPCTSMLLAVDGFWLCMG